MDKEDVRKYSRVSEIRSIRPDQYFYDLYSDEQVCDIVNNLEIHYEIPRQYNYFGMGARHWEDYVQRLAGEDDTNTLTGSIELLRVNMRYIDSLLHDYSNINVVDIGAGNAYPVRDVLSHLLKSGKLARYVALDISRSMLELARTNITTWFSDNIIFDGYEYDVNKGPFSSFVDANNFNNKAGRYMNLVFLLGGTLSNIRDPDNAYRMIRNSLTTSDILIHTTKLDNDNSRRYFDFNASSTSSLSNNHKLIFELLNIDESFYEVEMGYNLSICERYIRVRLNTTLKIEFVVKNINRDVYLEKGSTILVWRGIQHTVDSVTAQFDRNDLDLVHVSYADNQDYLLTISQRKYDRS